MNDVLFTNELCKKSNSRETESNRRPTDNDLFQTVLRFTNWAIPSGDKHTCQVSRNFRESPETEHDL